jgi:urea transport system permease protein
MRVFYDRFIAFVFALVLIAAASTPSRAGPYEDALLRFTADSFSETIEGVNGVVASGNPLAATVVGALQQGRLLFSAASKQVFIREAPDRLIDAATGQPAAPRPLTWRRCGSTIGCAASLRRRSAA